MNNSTTLVAPISDAFVRTQQELQVLEFLAERDPARNLADALLDERNWTVPREVAAGLVQRYRDMTVGQALVRARI